MAKPKADVDYHWEQGASGRDPVRPAAVRVQGRQDRHQAEEAQRAAAVHDEHAAAIRVEGAGHGHVEDDDGRAAIVRRHGGWRRGLGRV